MADTAISGAAMADTDYRYQGMTDSFIASNTMARDSAVQLGVDARGSLSKNFAAFNLLLDQWIGSVVQVMPAIVAASINAIAAVGADDALEFVKVGASLSNSASPPTPAYQNLGTSGPGQGLGGTGLSLPKGTVITVP